MLCGAAEEIAEYGRLKEARVLWSRQRCRCGGGAIMSEGRRSGEHVEGEEEEAGGVEREIDGGVENENKSFTLL